VPSLAVDKIIKQLNA